VGTNALDEVEAAAWVRLAALVELLPGVLDSQLRRDSALTHFEYLVLAMLDGEPERVLRMSALAARTNATLSRLSHVVTRLEDRGLVRRQPCLEDGRASNVELTDAGAEAYRAATPGHVAAVRRAVFDVLDPEQVTQVTQIAEAILRTIDPDGTMTALCRRPAPVRSG
jgi:DNA-binding MarR family transcriptional regulator